MVEKGGYGPAPRNDEIRSELREWLEDEPTLVETWVRDMEAWLVDLDLVVDEEVEIHRTGPPPIAVAYASESSLHVEQGLEQPARRQLGVDRDGAVQEARLLHDADRVGLTQRRDREHADALHVVQAFDRESEGPLAISEVGTETDVRVGHYR